MKKLSRMDLAVGITSLTACVGNVVRWFGVQWTPLVLVTNWAMILFLATLLLDVLLRMGRDGWWREHAVPILLTAIIGIAFLADFAGMLRLR